MPQEARSDSISGARFYTIVLVGLAGITILVQAAALGPLRESHWGFHLYAFLPSSLAVANWMVLILAAIAVLRPTTLIRAPATSFIGRRVVLSAVLLAIGCAVLFWIFRSQQDLLGDAHPLTNDLPKGQYFHPRQPVTMWLQQMLYQGIGGWFRREGVGDVEVAYNVVALGSVFAGFFFALVAVALGRVLTKPSLHKTAAPWMVTLILLSQGYALLFFGYVENYTYYTLLVATYLLTAALYLKGRLTLQVVAVVFLTSLALHLSTFGLAASFLFLLVWGFRHPGMRRDAAAAAAVLVAGLFVIDWAMRAMSPDYNLARGIREMIQIARTSQGGGAGLSYTFSSLHVREFLNEHFLIGPLAAFLFVPAVVFALHKRDFRDPIAVFFVLAAGSYLAGSWMMSEPLLGYARDWDLFAPAGVCYTIVGLYFMLRHVPAEARARRLLAFALLFSVLQLAPWVRINHSEALSLARFKTLPLGHGRTEVAVANWYMRNERPDQAAEWLRRALKANPNNANAYNLLANLMSEQGRFDLAREAYLGAIANRPDKVGFRNNYVALLLKMERYEEALPELWWLVERAPNNLTYWRSLRDVLIKLDQPAELPRVNEQTLRLFEEFVAKNPDNDNAWVETGILLADLERYEEALVKFRQALKINPNSAAALFNTASALAQTGRHNEARALLQKFVTLHPDHRMADWAREQLRR